MNKVKYSIEDLQELAREMNEVMGLDPEINTELGYQELLDTIKVNMEDVQAGRENEEMDDREEFTEHAWNMLSELGCDAAVEVAYNDELPEDELPEDELPEDELPEDELPEDEPEEESEFEESEEESEESEPTAMEDIAEEMKEAKKLKDLKKMVEFYSDIFKDIYESLDDYAGLQGHRKLKSDMEKVLSDESIESEQEETPPTTAISTDEEIQQEINDSGNDEEEPKEEKQTETNSSSNYSRTQSFLDAVQELCGNGATRAELLSKANELYDNANNTSTRSNPTNIAASVLTSLDYFGVLEYDKGKYKFNG